VMALKSLASSDQASGSSFIEAQALHCKFTIVQSG
jgi:hypothetical protein